VHHVVIIGCGKAKASSAREARELYTGSLFRARRRFAEATSSDWFILSARHGLLSPGVVVEPYELRITDLSKFERAELIARAAWSIVNALPLSGFMVSVDVHAGADYAEPLYAKLGELVGDWVRVGRGPLGLGIGQQLAWYKAETARARDKRAGELRDRRAELA
jgi:hypothetical protein